MLRLSVHDIHLGQQAASKEEAICQIAGALVKAGNVMAGYVEAMLARERQISTFLDNGIAIPHGARDARLQVLKTGVQIFQYPRGVPWGEGQIAYLVIAIAARSDEHLGLLHAVTQLLSDEVVAGQLKSAVTAQALYHLLMGERHHAALKLDNDTLTLDIAASDLVTLQALNAGRLKAAGVVDDSFVASVISDKPLNLGQGIWLNDSVQGNLHSAVAISRVACAFAVEGEPVAMLISVAIADDQPFALLKRLGNLLINNQADSLLRGDAATLVALLTRDDTLSGQLRSAEFVVRNAQGLHARPGAMLVNLIKQFNSEVTITNTDGSDKTANGRSLVKVMALGVKKGHRLRVTARGDDAQQALKAIGGIITDGFGEEG